MKLTFGEYVTQEVRCLGRWCLLHGPEHLLKREVLARLRAEARAAAGGEEPTWEVMEGADATASALLSASQTSALLGGARVLVVHGAEQMPAREQEALAARVGPLSPTVAAVLVTAEGRRGEKQIGATLRRAIEEHGLSIHFAPLRGREAVQWAQQRARELGKSLDAAAAHKLVEQKLGGATRPVSLTLLDLEVQKLATFVGDRPTISSADVEEVTPGLAEEDIFRLIDAVARQDAGRGVAVLRALLQERREAPPRVLAMIAQAIREIWQVKALLEHGWDPSRHVGGGSEVPEAARSCLLAAENRNALKSLARKPWLVAARVKQAQSFPWARLRRAIAALHECDLVLKGISAATPDANMALELLVLQLCRDLDVPLWLAGREGAAGG